MSAKKTKIREKSFTVTLTDEDLEKFDLDPTRINDEQFKEILEQMEYELQEQFGVALETAIHNCGYSWK